MHEVSERREPRFVYLCDASGQPAPDQAARYGWRLDAANHRPLARAVSIVDSLESCVELASTLRGRFAAAVLAVLTAGPGSRWGWRLNVDGVPVAVSPHTFPRRVECLRSYAQFEHALAVADPRHGVVRNYGPRALRGFELDVAVG